jgi:hypothetical protein
MNDILLRPEQIAASIAEPALCSIQPACPASKEALPRRQPSSQALGSYCLAVALLGGGIRCRSKQPG